MLRFKKAMGLRVVGIFDGAAQGDFGCDGLVDAAGAPSVASQVVRGGFANILVALLAQVIRKWGVVSEGASEVVRSPLCVCPMVVGRARQSCGFRPLPPVWRDTDGGVEGEYAAGAGSAPPHLYVCAVRN